MYYGGRAMPNKEESVLEDFICSECVHRGFREDFPCTSKFLMKEFAKFSFLKRGLLGKRLREFALSRLFLTCKAQEI